jgi:hypothetical protein
MADGPLLLVRSAPRLRLGSFMPASERRHPDVAVRNPPFAGVILAKAAFLNLNEDKNDARGRNNDTGSHPRSRTGNPLRNAARFPL